MRMNLKVALVLAGVGAANPASAHPGHAPTDLVAGMAAPFAGPDHALVFGLVVSGLLLAVRLILRAREAQERSVRQERPPRN